jgi:hypothetical protein
MPWPTVPDRIYTDRVKVRTVTWDAKDRAAGRQPTFGSWGADTYRCVVSAMGVSDAYEDTTQTVVRHCVTADVRIGNLGDQLQWQETGGILVIDAIEPAGDASCRIWNHYTQEAAPQ